MALLDDAQAKTLFDLIEAASHDFAFGGWESTLHNVRCFRVVGLDHLLRAHSVLLKQVFNNDDLKKKALAKIPQHWIDIYPTEDKGWEAFKKDQFSQAWNSKPIRLDKACIAILIACVALDEKKITVNRFFDYVKIRPQVYFIDGLEGDRFFNTPIEAELCRESGQITVERIRMIATKHRVTKLTALRIHRYLSDNGHIWVRGVVCEPSEPKPRLEREIILYSPADYDLPPLTVRAAPPAAAAG